MKRIIPLCLLLAACAGAGGETGAVRVLTFNIHAGKDAAQQPNLERVAAVIDSTDADIVLLQEVDRRTQRAGGVHQHLRLNGKNIQALHPRPSVQPQLSI